MADVPFEALSTRAQVARLRCTALDALERFGVRGQRLSLLEHGFNTTFRVDTTDGRRFALRICVNSRYGAEHVVAEVAWLEALATDAEVWVPVPQRTEDGQLMVRVHQPDLGREVNVVLMSWLPGRDVGDAITEDKLRATGRAMALLHRHGAGWRVPADGALPVIASVMMDVPDEVLLSYALLSAPERAVLDAALHRCAAVLQPVFTSGELQPIHADLHVWNTKWYRGRLSVFDFDDAGLGRPLQDLAIAAYYLRDEARHEAALLQGYTEVAPLPTHTTEQYEALVAARNLVLIHTVLDSENSQFTAMAPRYVPNSITKLRAYLDSGVYRHDVPGLLPREG